jgi:DNA-binding PadR family transcriptional regulator
LTGETQLRARRTRIKILRAIAERNGSAGFSDIRNATGLSTGSIYYHLERMENYVVKDSKHYTITNEGLQLLREIDEKSSSLRSGPSFLSQRNDEAQTIIPNIHANKIDKESSRIRWWSRDYTYLPAIVGIIIFVTFGVYSNNHLLSPGISTVGKIIANASLISSLSIAALLSASFLLMLKRQMLPTGYRGIMLSALTVLSVLVVNILIFSGLGSQIGANYLTF